MHQCAEFRRHRLNCGRDMVIFRFFKMTAAAILDFQNLKLLTFGKFKRVELRNHAKFCRNRSNGWRDIAIFANFQDGGRRQVGFLKFQIFNSRKGQEGRNESVCQITSKSVEPRPRYVKFNIILVLLRPFLRFLGAHFPQMMSLIVLALKGTILGPNHVIW